MRQTLFYIPREVAGIELFGIGWMFGLWLACSLVLVAWSFWKHGFGDETRGYVLLGVVGLVIIAVLPMISEPYGLPIRGWGVALLASILAACGLTLYRGRRLGLDQEMLLSLGTWLVVSGLIGARVFYIIEYWSHFQEPTLLGTIASMLNLTQGGMVVYGSLLAGGAALLVFVHKHHLPGLALADLVAPGVVLGVGLGRIGCFLNGCCYGGVCDIPWAVQFPVGSPAYIDQVQRHELYLHGLIFHGAPSDPPIIEKVEPGSGAEQAGLALHERVTAIGGERVTTVDEAQRELMRTFGAGARVSIDVAGSPRPKEWVLTGPVPRSLPVHPTQLYSLFDALLLCFLLLVYEPYKRWDGELAALVMTIHPITRFLLEIIRVDESAVFNTGMSISQNISLAIFVGGMALWAYLLWRRPRDAAWPTSWAVAGS